MKSKIVIVSDELNALGGVQKFSNSLANHLKLRGFEVTLLGRFHSEMAMDYGRIGVKETTVYDKSLRRHLRIKVDPSQSKSALSENQRELDEVLAKGRARLRKLIGNWDSNTVVIVTQVGSLMELFECGLVPGEVDSPKIIAQYHGTYEYARKQKYFNLLTSLFPRCDKSLFLTKGDLISFRNAGIDNAFLMQNGIERLSPDRIAARDPKDTVVSLGRYAAEKSLNELVEAWGLIAKEFPTWKLELYGSGPEEKKLQQQIENEGLTQSIVLCGLAANVYDTLLASKVNVMSSHKEGFPVSLLEAAACGVPSVAYDAGPSTRELISDGVSGYVTSSNTPKDLALNLRNIMANEDLMKGMSAAAYQNSSSYDISKIIDRWVDLIHSLLPGKPPSPIPTAIVGKIVHEQQEKNLKKETMQKKLTFHLRQPSENITLTYKSPMKRMQTKSFALKIAFFDAHGEEIDPLKTSLHYSESLGGGFVYTPESANEQHISLPLMKSSVPIYRVEVLPVPWEIRYAKVKPTLDVMYCESSIDIEGELWYRLESHAEISSKVIGH